MNKKVLITALFFIMSSVLLAQTNPGGPPCDPTPGCTFNCCTPVPIDSGLIVLLLAGLLIGIYTFKKN